MHIFAIGDWGGLDGQATGDMIFYKGGQEAGPHVFPRSRGACTMKDLQDCYNSEGQNCKITCGWEKGVDDQAQLLVAAQMRARAAKSDPSYVLNVGDNFYQGGIWADCGSPMHKMAPITLHQFSTVFDGVYHGPGLDGKKWLSVLGNHDWGGWQFNHAWDQQIAFTWHSPRWVMPAVYWSQLVRYPDQDFSAEFFMLDSNAMDAKPEDHDPDHNICGPNNPPQVSCSVAGGPASKEQCHQWFRDLWNEQKQWLERRLRESTADWQVVVTHFPCGFETPWFWHLHLSLGLDVLVTGHRHEQELWHPSMLGGLACFVTGGGGGITSEKSPKGKHSSQYGFFDLAISKHAMTIESINYNGITIGKQTVQPRHAWSQGTGGGGGGGGSSGAGAAAPAPPAPASEEASCARYGCSGFSLSRPCQCNPACRRYGNCCHDYETQCTAAPAPAAQASEEASCARYGCSGFSLSRPCQCNPACRRYGNCCHDYQAQCRRY